MKLVDTQLLLWAAGMPDKLSVNSREGSSAYRCGCNERNNRNRGGSG